MAFEITIRKLSRAKQKFVMEMLDTVIQQSLRGEFIMQTVKQIVHDIADHLPEQATFDDAMYAIYVRQKLERSLQAAKEGKVTSQEEMEKRYLNDAR